MKTTTQTNAVKTKSNGSGEVTNTMTMEVDTRHKDGVLFVVQPSTSASRTTGSAETGYESYCGDGSDELPENCPGTQPPQ